MMVDDLNELLRRVTQAYIDKGYVTTRAYLPQQELSKGILRVVVVEGHIEAIESQDGGLSAQELSMASPVTAGEALNLRDLEQLVDQLNRLPSNQASMELVPGGLEGGSRVQVSNDRQKPWRLSLGRDNDGSEGTGEQQWRLGVEWDSPLGLADQVVARLGSDANSQPATGSDNHYFSYRLPYGFWNFSYSYTGSDYRSLAEANGFTFTLEGSSERHQLRAERLLARDSMSKTSVSLELGRLSTRNYIDGSRIEVSSQQLSELAIGLNHGRRIGRGFLNVDIGWEKGLTIFGAQMDRDQPSGAPEAQYDKGTLTLSYQRPFMLNQENLSFSSLLNGQWSKDVLFSPERLSLGGRYSVRGFKSQSLSGDRGGYWRNQLSWQRPLDLARPLLKSMELTMAYDVGKIYRGAYNPELNGTLSGIALGLGLSGDHVKANISIARSLKRPDVFERPETPVYFSVAASF
ncbi:hemolysin activation/secretion protein [Onishia taeanensis]|uniref:Hemolysin activation/secretion protein n=2 Tax=Onishia taeanensis TaxID=284577 RepID=A0A1G7PCX9_9GAMM|nr:hemolysin activation/secretion protein [Halomonas taeanensis]